MSLHYFALLVSFFRKPHPSSFPPLGHKILLILPYLSDLSFSLSLVFPSKTLRQKDEDGRHRLFIWEAILGGANKVMGKVKQNRIQANKRCVCGQVGAVGTVSLG